MNKKMLAISLLLGGVALAGCGRMGDLERPAPMWSGAGSTAARATVDTPPVGDEETTGVQTTPNRQGAEDLSTHPAPPRTLPIPGQGSDPFQVAPQGSLPDPYANPQ